MKKLIALLLLILSTVGSSFAQQSKQNKDTLALSNTPIPSVPNIPGLKNYNSTNKHIAYLHKLNKETSEFKKSPFFIIKFNGKTYHFSSIPILSLLDQAEIKDMEIFQGKKADLLYHGTGKHGLIIIKVKNDIPTLSKAELLEKYNIEKKSIKLPVYIDSVIVDKRDLIFINNKIKSVTVAIDKDTGKKYISILTNIVNFEYDPYIRGTGNNSK